MISQSLPNFKTQFSQKGKASSYDNIALNQRNAVSIYITDAKLYILKSVNNHEGNIIIEKENELAATPCIWVKKWLSNVLVCWGISGAALWRHSYAE